MENNSGTVILASGFSERMGVPKALLKWDNQITFIERIIGVYLQSSCSRIVCVINCNIEGFCNAKAFPKKVRFAVNERPEWGRMHSLRTGLDELRGSDYYFIQNVDNPFVNGDVIEKLYSRRCPDAWCSPVYKGKGGHPVLIPDMIARIVKSSNNDDSTLMEILSEFKRIKTEVGSDSVLMNINTPEDYQLHFPGEKV